MTTAITVKAHLASTKEVEVRLNGELQIALQDGEEATFYVYDDRVIDVKEVLKPV